jgi:acyl-coenzyme A synthetase/AMP-(fatty) acid ligase
VVDAAVIPVPDVASGELPKAFIVLKELVSSNDARDVKEDIDRFVRRQKASYKWLRGGIDIVNTIPRSPSGKILLRLLKDTESTKQVMVARL